MKTDLLGTIVSFPENNKMVMFQDFRWWEGIPTNVEFKIESIANKSADEFWLVADGFGDLSKPNCYGNGKISVKRKDILEAINQMEMGINADTKKITILSEEQDSNRTYYVIKMETDKGDFFMEMNRHFKIG